MAASVNDASNKRRYICTSVSITPASKKQAEWAIPYEIPESESLPYSGSAQEGVRKEIVNFISNAGLPITLEPAPGMGAVADGPLIATSKVVLTLTKFAFQIGKLINHLRRSRQSRQRRLHLPVAHIMLFLQDTTETFIPLVALLPDLQKHIKKEFPSLQLDLSIHGSKTSLLTESGMIFDDALALRIIKSATKDSQQLIAVRQKSFLRFRTILCLSQNVTGLERTQQIRRFFGKDSRQ